MQRKKFRRVHGNVLDSDEEEEDMGGGAVEGVPVAKKHKIGLVRDESKDSSPPDEDFAHVS